MKPSKGPPKAGPEPLAVEPREREKKKKTKNQQQTECLPQGPEALVRPSLDLVFHLGGSVQGSRTCLGGGPHPQHNQDCPWRLQNGLIAFCPQAPGLCSLGSTPPTHTHSLMFYSCKLSLHLCLEEKIWREQQRQRPRPLEVCVGAAFPKGILERSR